MKDRLYKRNVVDAIPEFEKAKKDFALMLKRYIIYTILGFLVCVAIAIFCAVYISPVTLYFLCPTISGIFAWLFYLRYQDFKNIKILCADYSNYAVWMKHQLKKNNPNLEEDLKQAIDVYKSYISDIPKNQTQIAQILQARLRTKNNNQILISVLCGLLFICNDKKYRDIIYKAKYKHGASGNMVLSAWVLYYDDNLPSDITFEKLKNEFIEFWEQKLSKFEENNI